MYYILNFSSGDVRDEVRSFSSNIKDDKTLWIKFKVVLIISRPYSFIFQPKIQIPSSYKAIISLQKTPINMDSFYDGFLDLLGFVYLNFQ